MRLDLKHKTPQKLVQKEETLFILDVSAGHNDNEGAYHEQAQKV